MSDTVGTSEPTAPPRRRRTVRIVTLVVAVALLVAAVVIAVVRPGFGSGAVTASNATSPQRAVDGYYRALHDRNTGRAYALLCAARQAQSAGQYAASYAEDVKTGTGIKTWTRIKTTRVGTRAAVAGSLVLDNGSRTAITILAVRESGRWRVCDSSLGGIIPGPGTGSGSGGGTPT